MTPEKAIDLIQRYAALSQGIKAAKKRMSESMAACEGIDGTRKTEAYREAPDSKGRDKNMHLWNWYAVEYDDDGCVHHTTPIDADECPHCYAAHVAIQARKEMRLQLGHVKAAITRAGTLLTPALASKSQAATKVIA